ncbi:MAG: hypothetical protein CO138_00875 [Candidatus Moranbacteria bacterium CG_4_9_14_3_um_filter_33_15]|nr:MAG: hypothetical protein COT31_03455 [Candidatus Moranbacteria bacterium CG08_land_8_20_14_0_20_34_16]PJA89357.1 MAG: hypothetical protein CO138_00875 [Candidatus Moranbacteria bacterium CG_4_9_14_3_um_filter_33_15]
MEKRKKMIVFFVAIVLVSVSWFFWRQSNAKNVKQIKLNENESSQNSPAVNNGPVSPISGLSCENWNKRPVAVMQPADVQARPAAGFSEADMVIEMPAYTSSVTRLLGVYLCNIPKEIGAIRSSRHDYIALAKGLDAFFIHWGGSHFALDLLKENVIDHIDCMNTNYCARWGVSGKMRVEDTGHIGEEKILQAMDDLGIRKENNFSGYPHREEAPIEERPSGGHLRVAFAKPYDVEYDYDKESNSYLRTWGEDADIDKNNQKRIAPKNVAVLFAYSDQITINQNYVGKGLRDPWLGMEEIKKTGSESISGRYNNVQIGDPWYDESGSGPARYYMNGKEYAGNWKKDKSKIDSKLFFYDEYGKEIQFVPGQIWVEILEPGQNLKWEAKD